MTSIWGNLQKPTTIKLDNFAIPGKTLRKSEIRQRVWDFLEKHDLVNFPRPAHKHIPNFIGAATAGQSLSSLPEFMKAGVIKVNPDKPQEEVRLQTLAHRKTLLVPTPRLAKGLFNLIDNPGDSNKKHIKKLASRAGIDYHSKPVPLTTSIKIDMIVLGCVAVDKKGYRIGKGEGYADLEYAMAVSLGAVNANTIVVATVHDCQLFDSLPEEIFGEHDVSVDIIVTPTLIHRVEHRLPKPKGIIWKILSFEKFRKIPVLKQMRVIESKAGKDVRLKGEIDSEGNTIEKKSYPKQNGIVNGNIEENEVKRTRRDVKFKDEIDSGDNVIVKKTKPKQQKEIVNHDIEKTIKQTNIVNHDIEKTRIKQTNRPKDSKSGKGVKLKDILDNDEKSDQNRKETVHQDTEGSSIIKKPTNNPNKGEENYNNPNKGEENYRKPKNTRIYNNMLYVGKIKRGTRVRELKEAMLERGIRAKQLVWKGFKGFAFAYFEDTENIDELLEALKDLKIGDSVLDIQKEKTKEDLDLDIENEKTKEDSSVVDIQKEETRDDSISDIQKEKSKED